LQEICDKMAACKAFELGVAYGGGGQFLVSSFLFFLVNLSQHAPSGSLLATALHLQSLPSYQGVLCVYHLLFLSPLTAASLGLGSGVQEGTPLEIVNPRAQIIAVAVTEVTTTLTFT
jgi:hypothetical protein